MQKLVQITVILLLVFSANAQDNENYVRNGSFENNLEYWSATGRIYFSTNLASYGEKSFGVSTNSYQYGYLYQYFSEPIASYEAGFSVFPQSDTFFNIYELVANWDSRTADFISRIVMKQDSIQIRTMDRDTTFAYALQLHRWHHFKIVTDSSGWYKNYFINNEFVCRQKSSVLLPIETLIVGDLSEGGQFGAFHYDNFSLMPKIDSTVTEPDVAYFPLQIGNSWHYEYALPDSGSAASAQIFDTTYVDDKLYFHYGEDPQYPHLVRADSLNRVWRRTLTGEVIWFDTTLGDSATYEVDLWSNNHPLSVIVKRDVTVETSAGVFENCIEFYFDDPLSYDEELRFTLAPGVGIVREQIASITKLLSSAQIGDELITGTNENSDVISTFTLHQNYPNPFNPSTQIAYDIALEDDVDLSIYNVRGEKIRSLVQTKQQPGSYTVTWDGYSDNGIQVASGVYFYRLIVGQFEMSRILLLVR